jgi:maltose alpha-D-glucosyltransferase/alpha-amylase
MGNSSGPQDALLTALHKGLPSTLPEFLTHRRWFGGKARTIHSVEVFDIVPFCPGDLGSYFIVARVRYASGPPEIYDIPLVCASGQTQGTHGDPGPVLRIPRKDSADVVFDDALSSHQFLHCLLDAIAKGDSFRGAKGEVCAVPASGLRSLWQPGQGTLTPTVIKAEQSNSSVIYEKRLMLKLFRKVEEGLNPDVEIGSFLTEKSSFRNVPPLAGHLDYSGPGAAKIFLGILQGYVANEGDAWQFTEKALADYFQKAGQTGHLSDSEVPKMPLLALSSQPIPNQARRRIGPYLDSASLLGTRTAELHLALASAPHIPDFAPQPFSQAGQRALVNSVMDLLTANFHLLRQHKDGMPAPIQQEAEKVLGLEERAQRHIQLLLRNRPSAMLTRIHGDYHLGQVLVTGTDFVIIDFEGEPARSLEERRRKRSPLQDVAGMLRSFHYAAYAPLLSGNAQRDDTIGLGRWAAHWLEWVSVAFLKAYLEVAGNSPFIPRSREELALLLDLYLLEKAIYELGYELNNRPTWVAIPLDGVSQLLQDRNQSL